MSRHSAGHDASRSRGRARGATVRAMIRPVVLLVALAPACGDDGGAIDAFVPVDIDNGSCGGEIRFTGEYIDWDQDQGFCGIFNARFQVQGGGAMDTTAPNGRFDLCIPDQPTTLLDVTQPAAASPCAQVAGNYALPAIALANKTVILSGAAWSGRAFTMNREPTIDPTKAQLVVNVEGTPRAVSIDASHGPAQAVTSTTWAPGNVGHEVYFPNVDPSAGSTMLSVEGGAIGTGMIPLVAGKLINVTVLAN